MTSKLRVKLGRIELEFEGSEDFIKQELKTVLAEVKTLSAAMNLLPDDDDEDFSGGDKKSKTKTDSKLTTSTIAANLKVSSGPELIIAALARLCIVGGAEKASRKEIIKEMRTATAYFNENYVGNLSTSLKTLTTSKRINDLGSSNYSLSATEQTALEPKVAAAK
jgi:hypothetical protein